MLLLFRFQVDFPISTYRIKNLVASQGIISNLIFFLLISPLMSNTLSYGELDIVLESHKRRLLSSMSLPVITPS
jgi:hypothetical protein